MKIGSSLMSPLVLGGGSRCRPARSRGLPRRSLRGADPRVMLLDGESGGPYHKWQATTHVLKKQLDETGLFDVDVVTAPPAGASFSAFKPDFAKYQAVVLNYDAPDDRWPAELKASFERYVTRRRRRRHRARGRQRVSRLEGVQRDDRRRRLARSHRSRPDRSGSSRTAS